MPKKLKKNSIGILGGTFDPPHYGHIGISKIAIKKLMLENVFWVVTRQNPLKSKPDLSLNTRIQLCKIILKKNKKIKIKNIRKKFNFLNTFDLLNYFKKGNKKKKIYFLMGADNIINFHKWKKWKKIPSLAKIVIFARPGFTKKSIKSLALKKLNRQNWIYINDAKFDISSTKLKNI